MQKKMLAIGIIVTLLVLGFGAYFTYASSSGTSSGSADMTAPEVQYFKICAAGSGTNITTLDVDSAYDLKVYIYDVDQLNDIFNVTIRMAVNPASAIGASSPAYDENTEYWFRFRDSSSNNSNYDAFEWYNGANWVNSSEGTPFYLGENQVFGSSPSTASECTWRWHTSKVAEHSSQWDLAAIAFDRENQNSGSQHESAVVMNFYTALTVTDTTHAWSTTSGQTNVALTTPADGKIEFTAICNAVWKMQAKGDGALTSGLHTIGLGNVTIHKDTVGSSTSLTTSYANIEGLTSQTIPSTEAGTATYCKLWIDTPAGQSSGHYTYTLTLLLTE